MNNLQFLAVLAITILFSISCNTSKSIETAEKPNVIIILTDDQGWGDLSLYDNLPAAWDDTKILEGKMHSYVTVARKSKEDWFIGSLAANKDRELQVPLTFLDENTSYEATIYFQSKNDLKNNVFKTEKIEVNKGTVIK